MGLPPSRKKTVTRLPCGVSENETNQPKRVPLSEQVPVLPKTGSAWKFLRMKDKAVTLDLKEYYIDDPGKILGVLESLVRSS